MYFNKLKKYKELPLIKSDTNENLFTYWDNLYSEDTQDFITPRFESNIRNLKHTLKLLRFYNVFFTNQYIVSIILMKTEIFIVHCLVLEKYSEDEQLKKQFKSLNLSKNRFTKAILNKISKEN